MKLFDIPFKLSEELIDTVLYFLEKNGTASENLVFKSIGKTESYMKKSLTALILLNALDRSNQNIVLNKEYRNENAENGRSILKRAIMNFDPFKQYLQLLNSGKREGAALKIVKAVYTIANDVESIKNVFAKYQEYLDVPTITNKEVAKIVSEPSIGISKSQAFISLERINGLKNSPNTEYDLKKLIRICEELNDGYDRGNYYSVGLLVRVVLDHIPPAFKKRTFSEVVNNHVSKSFKDVMSNLENFNRKIADGFLHSHLNRKESLPNHLTVDCRSAIDMLLGETINELN